MSLRDPSMEDLPVEIMMDILSRLPVKTIIHCKCVCKKWLNIVLDSGFADLQISRSPAGLMVLHIPQKERMLGYQYFPGILKWVEVEDEPDHHHFHHDPVMSFDLNLTPICENYTTSMAGSVDGLICLWQCYPNIDNTYICNPITREYMTLPKQNYRKEGCDETIEYCFGVGLVTKEYKVLRIFRGDRTPNSRPGIYESEIYTLGSGQWRSLGQNPYWLDDSCGPYLNGHIHWIIFGQHPPENVCSFDFDKETFQLFPSPPAEDVYDSFFIRSFSVMNGCLCRCENYDDNLTVWVMKEYGIKKSWHKELVFERSIESYFDLTEVEMAYLVQGLKDGTMLVDSAKQRIFVYDTRRKTLVDELLFDGCFHGMVYRPSFRRLQNFKNERVDVF